MKNNLLVLLFIIFFISGLIALVQAQNDSVIWKDDMNYQSFDQLQAAGWTSEHPVGISFGSVGVILDQTHGDTAIHYGGHFESGIYNWKVEDQSRWISGPHSGNDVSAITEKHSYIFMADGWYSQFAFYHDGSKVYTSQKGTYTESKGALFTLSMVRINSQINCYYNGQLEYTYIESDSTPSQLTSVDAVSPWGGSSEYDYFQLSSASVFPSSTSSQSNSILSNPVAVGGIAGGAAVAVGVGVGLAIHFGVIGGGAAGSASAGSGTGAVGSAGSASGSSGAGGEAIASSGGDGGSSGGDAGDSNLLADAGNVQQMQQANAATQQATTLQSQMQQSNQAQANQLQQTQQDTQTKIMQNQQDVTQNKQKSADKASQTYDDAIRASNDPDAVADSGGGSGGSEA